LNYNELLKEKGLCDCGISHEVKTQGIVIEKNAIARLSEILGEYDLPKDVMVVSDTNTFMCAGKDVAENLLSNGYKVNQLVFDSKELMHPDEKSVGQLMFAAEPEPEMIIAVGSGTLNDLCRFCAKRIKIKYMVVATAPSMDGYASTVSPITRNGVKRTFSGIHPEIIVGDLEVLRKAPMRMLAAGFGDIVGKVPARLDWILGNILIGERMCERVESVTNMSVEKCIKASGKLKDRSEDAIRETIGALIISGIAIQMNGDSRPASGAEHHISHFLEMKHSDRHNKDALHGANVGIASLITMRFYQKLFDSDCLYQKDIPSDSAYEKMVRKACGKYSDTVLDDVEFFFFDQKKRQEHVEIINNNWEMLKSETANLSETIDITKRVIGELGGPVHPLDLGYSRDDMYDAIKFARLIRPRYTILDLLDNMGLLESFTTEILDELY